MKEQYIWREIIPQMSRLVVTEIITQPCMTTRVQCIEKWAAVADICKCLHNFNGVLQICSALTNSSVYRLRNTWNRVSKSVSIPISSKADGYFIGSNPSNISFIGLIFDPILTKINCRVRTQTHADPT